MNPSIAPRVSIDEQFTALSSQVQTRLLIELARELTLVARNYYVPGTLELNDPVAVRLINEIQHRVTAHAAQTLSGCDTDAPVAYGFISDCWDHADLRQQVEDAFHRVYRRIKSPEVTTNGTHHIDDSGRRNEP